MPSSIFGDGNKKQRPRESIDPYDIKCPQLMIFVLLGRILSVELKIWSSLLLDIVCSRKDDLKRWATTTTLLINIILTITIKSSL